jgi:hypothetical protein
MLSQCGIMICYDLHAFPIDGSITSMTVYDCLAIPYGVAAAHLLLVDAAHLLPVESN